MLALIQTIDRLLITNVKLFGRCVQSRSSESASSIAKLFFSSYRAGNMDEISLAFISKQIAPPLANNRHKGQAGRIGVFGGSLEYTGAPYFSAISSLKVGADLVHVFCTKAAGGVIKSYSPELIVHPILDADGAIGKIEPWLERLHMVLIGPGMGREPETLSVVTQVINLCRSVKKPLVIDADGLFLVSQNPSVIKDYPAPGVILTPNVAEFARLFPASGDVDEDDSARVLRHFGRSVTVLRKGQQDEIMDHVKKVTLASEGGSGRRCGGQGDLLAGSLATFYTWVLQYKMEEDVAHDDRAMVACYAACKLCRECNSRAFAKQGRGMVCSDMIHEIPGVFRDNFELK